VDLPKYVLDTNAAILLLKSETAREHFNNTQLFASVINRIELLSKPELTADDEQEIRSFLDDITIVGINDLIENETIAIRRSSKIRLPDCIVAATSIILNAVLLTRDDQLLKLVRNGYKADNSKLLS
jgi:predicted nucleic acid-binding protein